MRVGQLKQMLAAKGAACKECVEKSDYVAKVKEVFGVSEAAAHEEL